jgi:oligopeptide/dipeptide ABC transporter ATP-binding protein
MTEPLLSATSLSKAYTESGAAFSRRRVAALQDVSFDLAGGETLAITGESGSGKSTLAFIVARLEDASGGSIRLAGLDWLALRGRALRDARRNVQIVFQDPATSLNPRLPVGESVGEPLRAFRGLSAAALRREVATLLASVGIDPSAAGKRPREFSGGERQRIAIARAIAPSPRVIVCDEPVAALDPSARARVLNLLLDLQASTGVAYLFISHDLDAVAQMADRVAVLYAGRIVEEAPAADFFSSPRHPYSVGLLSGGAIPGEPPASSDEPSGCPFHPRCPEARPRCSAEEPGPDFSGGRRVACFFWRETAEKTKLSSATRVIR